jgi:hypothetical protein
MLAEVYAVGLDPCISCCVGQKFSAVTGAHESRLLCRAKLPTGKTEAARKAWYWGPSPRDGTMIHPSGKLWQVVSHLSMVLAKTSGWCGSCD